MIKTISEIIEGPVNLWGELTLDLKNDLIHLGVTFGNESYNCDATLSQVMNEFSTENREIITNFIKCAHKIAINNGLEPDILLINEDIPDDFKTVL